jgi:hypothetical protein
VRVLALRHDALKTQLAGVREHERAVLVVEVLIEQQPRCRAPRLASVVAAIGHMSGRFNPPGHGQCCPCPRRFPQQFRAAAFRIEPRSLTMQDDGSSEGGAPMKALMLLALAGLSTMAGAAEPATLTLACKGTMTDKTEADAKPMPISMGIVNFTEETIIGGFAPSPQHGAGLLP